MGDKGIIYELNKKIQDGTSYYKAIIPTFDEIHKYINESNMRKQIEFISEFDSVKECIGTTGTPGPVWETHPESKWRYFNAIDLRELLTEDYCGCDDHVWNIVDDYFDDDYKKPGLFDHQTKCNDVLGFINHVFEKFPDILTDYGYWFIPGSHIRRSHNIIQDTILKHNSEAVIFVYNGERKEMVFLQENRTKNISLENEFGELPDIMYSALSRHNLLDRPRVVTGHVCIGMGQTLCNEKLGNFTGAILSGLDLTNDDLYQLVGRLFGRFKKLNNYKPTEIYSPTITKEIVKCMECSAKEELLSYDENGKTTLERYLSPANEYLKNSQYRDRIANNYIKSSSDKKAKQPKKEKENEDNFTRGFVYSKDKTKLHEFTKNLSPGCHNIDYTKNTILKGDFYAIAGPGCQSGERKVYDIKELYDHAFNKALGSHLDTIVSKLQVGQCSKRRYICYESKDDPNSIVYCLIFVKRVHDGTSQTLSNKKLLEECNI